MKRFKGLVVVVAVYFLILEESGGSAELVVRLQEHDECTSEHDPRLLRTCLLGDQFKLGYQCQLTPGLTCLGQMYVGDGSVCTRLGTRQFFRCSLGVWKGNTDSEDVDDFPAHDIEKRGFRVRIRIRIRIRCCRRRRRGGGGQKPANQPPNFNYCPSVPQQTADPGTLTKTVSWPPPTATDPDGGSPSITTAGSQTSGSVFHEGTTTVVYKARDTHGGTDYCTVTVQVTVVRCQTGYRQLQNGEQQCSGPRHDIYGSQCTHHCDDGYQLVGDSSVVQCQSNGQWSHAFPTCQAVSCGDPGTVAGGSIVCPNLHSYPAVCQILCLPGYTHGGTTYLRCQADRTWTAADACMDTEAPSFPSGCPANQQLFSGPLKSPVSVTWDDPEVKDNSDQTVTLTSSVAKNSTLGVGLHVIWVTAKDAAGNSATCNFVVNVQEKTCTPLTAPSNSHVTCTHGYTEGSECTVTCNPGYELQGGAITRCDSSGSWNSSLPVCNVISCSAPVNVSHGSFQCNGGLEYRSSCTLNCDPGFSGQGSLAILCQSDATWSSGGSCADTEPPEFVKDPCLPNIDVFAPRIGQQTFVNFSDPLVTDNSGSDVDLTSDVTSGASFPIGVTQVMFTAADAAGNERICQFTVTVTSLVCDSPDLELPNRTRTLMTYACPDGYVHGATCLLGCSHGLPLLGASNITCERDDHTYPPTMDWEWPDSHLGKPQCIDNNCPALAGPTNGALACFPTNFGQDCLMSCNTDWDIPASNGDRFTCSNSNGFWIPDTVPGCVVRVRPGHVRAQSDLFYYTGSCPDSLDSLKQNFITRINNSTYGSICSTIPSCVWQNIQVTCGPLGAGRKKREAGLEETAHLQRFTRAAQQQQQQQPSPRQKRQSHYVLVEFEILLEYNESSQTPQQAYQTYSAVILALYNHLQAEATAGHFDLPDLTMDPYGVGYPRIAIDCPPGTLFVNRQSANFFTCAGCYKGHYLPIDTTQCLECSRGSFSEEDNATSCTPCPQGWSTPSTGAQNHSECKEMCLAGSFSPDGFVPCQACPPGYYQSQNGSSHCSPCSAGTWTSASNATSLEDCQDADVRLSANQSLSAKVTSQWGADALNVSLWTYLGVNSSCIVSLQLGSQPGPVDLSVILDSGPGGTGSELVVDLDVTPNSWTSVMFGLQPENSPHDLVLYRQGLPVDSFHLGVAVDMPVNLWITAASSSMSDALVSGLRANSDSNVTGASATCTGDKSTNLMTWVPSPSSVFIPSSCDAVDECLSSPCGVNGVCQNLPNGYHCDCQNGVSGAQCQIPPGVCDQHQCQNGAGCVPQAAAGSEGSSSNYSCVCGAQHSGPLCELEKVHGVWGSWTVWESCSATCGGVQQRHRLCNNPPPENQGLNCTGPDTDTVACGGTSPLCPVDGGFSPWTPYGSCSATCEGGERTRTRQCDNPAPQNNGFPCAGPAVDKDSCSTQACPDHGGWGSWSTWEFCSVTCGNGSQSQERSCDSPVPSNGGQQCAGPSNQTRACNLENCPKCSQLVRPSGVLISCEEETNPTYLQTCTLTCLPGHVSAVPFPTYTCGEDTGFLWNHQRDHHSPSTQIHSCTRPSTLTKVVIYQEAQLDTQCDAVSESAVRQNIYDKFSAAVPCLPQNLCSATVTSNCLASARRRRRSADPMVVSVEVTIPLGSSQTLDANDTSSVEAYEELLAMVEDSFVAMTQNDTTALFTVTVDGYVITPTNVTSDVYASCPSGYTGSGEYCVECPAGMKEEDAECVLCPMGQYQDQTASASCKDCPQGLSWDLLGATDISQCLFPYSSPTNNSNDDDSNESDDDDDILLLIVGPVCGAVALILIIVVIVYRKNRLPNAGPPHKWARPSSAVLRSNRVSLVPAADGKASPPRGIVSLGEPPLFFNPGPPSRPVTPSVLQINVQSRPPALSSTA